MTLLVRDEIDIIGHWLDHHLPLIETLVITDNGSVDGTREVLAERAAADGRIVLIDEPGRDFKQNTWVDRMIRACIDLGADWIVNSDADEFWYCRWADLEAQPEDVGGLWVRSRNVVPTIRDDMTIDNPVQRMRWWVPKPRSEFEWWCMRSWGKVLHRARGWRANVLGNHAAELEQGLRVVPAPAPWRIDHYSNRSWPQYRRKYINGGEAYAQSSFPKEYGFHWRERYAVYAQQGGIVALKRRWLSEIETDMTRVVNVRYDPDAEKPAPADAAAKAAVKPRRKDVACVLAVDAAGPSAKRDMRRALACLEKAGVLGGTMVALVARGRVLDRELPDFEVRHVEAVECLEAEAVAAAKALAAPGCAVTCAAVDHRRGVRMLPC